MAVQDIEVYGPALTDANGVLAVFVQQPVTNTPAEVSKNRVVYTEKWKGPYEKGKTVLSSVKVGDALTTLHTFLGANRISRFDTPACPTREGNSSYWQIKAIKVDEHTAGDHCFITVDTEAYVEESESGGDDLNENKEANTWSVTWQSYSVTPYEFASGEVHKTIVFSDASEGGDESHININWDYKASRTVINQYLTHNPNSSSAIGDNGDVVYTWTPNPKQPHIKNALCGAEMELLKKINQNRNATYHYPIVTHQTQLYGESGSSFTKELGSDLDVITTLPSDCPYTFAKIKTGTGDVDWTWIKIGDDMQQTKTETTTTFTRTERWAGYTDVDENYYGSKTFTHDENGIKTGRWYKNCL